MKSAQNTKKLPVRIKLTLVFLLSTLVIFGANLFIFSCFESMMVKVNDSYISNVELMELQSNLENLRTNLTEYLSNKGSDPLTAYYTSENKYINDINKLNDIIYNDSSKLMEKSIKNMSEKYIALTEEAVDAKRGGNTTEFTEKYEDAEVLYQYIYTYIYSLNTNQFQTNSLQYEAMAKMLRRAETASLVIMILVGVANVGLITFLTGNIIDPIESYITNARLKYLQAQVNPHFLFNTLNAGAQLAMLEDADRTYTYIHKVSEFFRYNLKSDLDQTTLEDEIQLVDNYLYILNVRFAGEIEYEKIIDETLLDAVIPAMVLQPIIENSVNHGLRNVDHDKKITLRVYKEDDDVCVSISDNGIGITQEKIREIYENRVESDEEETDSNGIGLNNVIKRLRLFYDREDIIEITSEGPDMGTEMVIYIPKGQ